MTDANSPANTTSAARPRFQPRLTSGADDRVEPEREHRGEEDRQQRAERQDRERDEQPEHEQRQQRPAADDDLDALWSHGPTIRRAPGEPPHPPG